MRQNRAIIVLGNDPTDADLLVVGDLQKLASMQNELFWMVHAAAHARANNPEQDGMYETLTGKMVAHIRGMGALKAVDVDAAAEKLVHGYICQTGISVFHTSYGQKGALVEALGTDIFGKNPEVIPAGMHYYEAVAELSRPGAQAVMDRNSDHLHILIVGESHSVSGDICKPERLSGHVIQVTNIHPDDLFRHLMHQMQLDQQLPGTTIEPESRAK